MTAGTVISMRVSRLIRDPQAQPRVGTNPAVVSDYAERIQELPPVVAFGTAESAHLADGWHRVAGLEEVGGDVIDVDLRPGGLTEAIWYAAGANREHGLRMTAEDRHRAIGNVLRADPRRSNVEIARQVGVGEATVRRVRADLEASSSMTKMETRTVERNGQTYTQQTANIGQRPTPVPKPTSSQPAHRATRDETVFDPDTDSGTCGRCGEHFDGPHSCEVGTDAREAPFGCLTTQDEGATPTNTIAPDSEASETQPTQLFEAEARPEPGTESQPLSIPVTPRIADAQLRAWILERNSRLSQLLAIDPGRARQVLPPDDVHALLRTLDRAALWRTDFEASSGQSLRVLGGG